MYNKKEERITGLILGISSLALTVHLFFWYLGNPQHFIEHRLGINATAFNNPTVWLFTLIITIGYILYTAKAVPFVRKYFFTFSWLKVIGIWAAFIFSTLEEILFRQILMDLLMRLDYSVTLQVLASALIFGFAHGSWIFLRGEFKIALPVILSTTVLGALLAILYIIADRNILAPIVAHILINLFIEPWLILSSVTGKWKDRDVESRKIT